MIIAPSFWLIFERRSSMTFTVTTKVDIQDAFDDIMENDLIFSDEKVADGVLCECGKIEDDIPKLNLSIEFKDGDCKGSFMNWNHRSAESILNILNGFSRTYNLHFIEKTEDGIMRYSATMKEEKNGYGK